MVIKLEKNFQKKRKVKKMTLSKITSYEEKEMRDIVTEICLNQRKNNRKFFDLYHVPVVFEFLMLNVPFNISKKYYSNRSFQDLSYPILYFVVA